VSITNHIDFWKRLNTGHWEPYTFNIFDHFITADTIFLDIGSWIGPTALYAAQIAKHSYAFEPDPVAFKELENNVSINKDSEWIPKLTIYNKAIASYNGSMKLGNKSSAGNSMSSVLFSDNEISWEVETITLEKFIEDEKLHSNKLFLKVDIEGGEYELIPTLKSTFKNYNITLFLSIHCNFLMNSLKPKDVNENRYLKIIRRLRFSWYHIKLVRAMPFKYFYRNNGKPINLFAELINVLFLGKFPNEIVATNEKWH
jgi:FkbM family methyltransferase